MRVVVEIYNGCISNVLADRSCEVLIIDRDELGDAVLRDGARSFLLEYVVPGEPRRVEESYALAGYDESTPT